MSRPRQLGAASALLLALVVAAPASGQAAPEVVKLWFEGARAFHRADLAAAIATSATRCHMPFGLCIFGLAQEESYLDADKLQADALRIRAFYYERGYRNAAVETAVVPDGDDAVRVVFRIDEGRPVLVENVEIVGAPAEVTARALPLRLGAPFDMLAREAGRDTLLDRLRNTGYARAQVLLGSRIPADSPYAATVTYDVIPGRRARIGPIDIVGTEETTPELVHRMLTFEEGRIYDRSAILESQRNLYALQVYRHAEIGPDLEAEPDTIVPITIQLVEGAMHRVRFGGGLNTVECANLEGRWTSRNFLGGGRRLDVRGRLGNLLVDECQQYLDPLWTLDDASDTLTGLVSFDFTQPWFFGPRNNIGAGLFAERRSLPEVFVRSAVGGYVTVGRTLGRGSAITFGYRPELTELVTPGGDLFFCVSFIACAYEEIESLQRPHWLSPLTLSFSLDRTDAVFTPTRGTVLRADLEHAAPYTGSDFAYTRLLAEGSTYSGRPGAVVLATRLRGGIAWPRATDGAGLRLNPQKRFFAGGSNSVRGFGPYRLGPTVLGVDAVSWLAPVDDPADPEGDGVDGAGCTVAEINDRSCDPRPMEGRPGAFEPRPAGGELLLEGNVELRFPLPIGGGKLRGAAFLDAGQVWATAESFDLGEVVATPGLGVRYLSPVGPIRVDAGFNLQGSRSLPVITTEVEECMRGTQGCVAVPSANLTLRNTDRIVVLDQRIEYQPFTSGLDTVAGWLQRFQLHFAIGQAF